MTPIVLERASATPLYRQIEEQLRSAILSARLRPGTQLPGVRTLASQLGVARITVVQAYDQLASEGYLIGRVGSGTTIALELPDRALRVDERPAALRLVSAAGGGPPTQSQRTVHDKAARPALSRVAGGGQRLPAKLDDAGHPRFPATNPWVPAPESVAAVPGDELPYDFGQWRISMDAFPIDLWERLLRSAWRDMSGGPSGTSLGSPPLGDPGLRETLADYLGAARSVTAQADRVVITTGIEASTSLCSRAWLGAGRRAALEDPTNPLMRRALTMSGTDLSPVPVDVDGLRVDRLPAAATLVAVSPSWQFPMGGTMPMHRRLALLDWAARAGALVLENDHSGEFRYQGPPLPSLQGLDRDGRVLYMNSFNRLMPVGFHLGFIVLPEPLVESFMGMAEAVGHAPSSLEQRALARFVADGHYDRYLRRVRGVLADRQAILIGALRKHLGSVVTAAPAEAGMHLVVTLDERFGPASEVAERARAAGVGVATVERFRMTPGRDRELVFFYSTLDEDRIGEGLRRLARILFSRDATHRAAENPPTDKAPGATANGARQVTAHGAPGTPRFRRIRSHA
ncbi:MAG: PLP-dependent aminotransferase family protein [Candidatus Limnocylindrales bacterium]